MEEKIFTFSKTFFSQNKADQAKLDFPLKVFKSLKNQFSCSSLSKRKIPSTRDTIQDPLKLSDTLALVLTFLEPFGILKKVISPPKTQFKNSSEALGYFGHCLKLPWTLWNLKEWFWVHQRLGTWLFQVHRVSTNVKSKKRFNNVLNCLELCL